MKHEETIKLFKSGLPGILKVENSGTEDLVINLGPFSCLMHEGKWTIEKEWSSFSRDSGWDGGSDPVEDDPGHERLADALVAMARLYHEEVFDQFMEQVGETERHEHEIVENIMGS
jgi:hypothetical protein